MLLSIIIPTFNEERALRPMLRALQAGLSKYEYEVIVSDGGSKDATQAIAREAGAKLLVRNGTEKHTIGWGRNRGAEAAQGTYLVFIDAGVEIPEPNKFFERLIAHFDRDPKLAAVTVPLQVFPKEATWADDLFFTLADWTHWLNNNVWRLGSASGKFQMFRTEVFRRARGYREDLAVYEDNEIFSRLARKFGRTFIDMKLVAYHGGRRAHALGWPKLLWLWIANWFMATFFDRSANKDWEPIR